MPLSIADCLEEIKHNGFRRLLVISGDPDWCKQYIDELSAQLTPCPAYFGYEKQRTLEKTVLGTENQHIIFDVHHGFHAEALAILAGTMSAGHLLILVTPSWPQWLTQPDHDSLRWSGCQSAIATPHFIQHVQRTLLQDNNTLFIHQYSALEGQLLGKQAVAWQKPQVITADQQKCLLQLSQATTGYFILTAERGRGKSALAGMLAKKYTCWVTAPQKRSVDILFQFADNHPLFFAPDHLLSLCHTGHFEPPEWLIIDEAASIPMPMLEKIIPYFSKVLLTTTVEGYEGTGMGFLLKFCANHPNAMPLTLTEPIRWNHHDPVEKTINDLFLLKSDEQSDTNKISFSKESVTYCPLTQHALINNKTDFYQNYQLLKASHYRTTLLDLRRILDAPALFCTFARDEHAIIGSLLTVKEGGLSYQLAQQIWAGTRRPKGNLVAQSLTAHAGEINAAILNSLRISRIAVKTSYRRQKIASTLLAQCHQFSQQHYIDFLSVSFGYTVELYQFWRGNGFQLVHIGSRQEASSGCYAAMMILPLSDAGKLLMQTLHNKLRRNWPWMKQIIALELPISCNEIFYNKETEPDKSDQQELFGFAYQHRTIESARAALARILPLFQQDCPLLYRSIYLQQQDAQLIEFFNLPGKRQLIQKWRQEAQLLLTYWQE